MDQVSTLERLFRYKADSNMETLLAMRLFDEASPAKEIAIRVLSHTYVVDQIFAANLTAGEHGYTSANTSDRPSLEQLSAAIKNSDQWYIDYVSRLDQAQLAERIDFTFTDGEPGRMSREEMLMHVAIHGAGHRGQVGWIMMENSITPPADRFTSYLHKAEASTRRRLGGSSDTVESPLPENQPNVVSLAEQGMDGMAAEEGKGVSPLDELIARMKRAVGANPDFGETLKFDLKGDGFIYVGAGSVSNEDKPADLILTLTIDDLKAISYGKLAPVTAIMSGRLSVSDMGVAAGLQGKLQALFSRMRPAS
ncbi:MAG TPA: DinB family protein [Candidatus Binataceae bacterium]|nr:DinB family protein [Candidatus Binataceae bacterium]